jgi:hypothetical protein
MLIVLTVTSVLSIENSLAKTQVLSDAQVKQKVIEESIAAYPGPCACPFNQARNGSSCGKRSAWSKPGGYDPICYASEVTPQMIKAGVKNINNRWLCNSVHFVTDRLSPPS